MNRSALSLTNISFLSYNTLLSTLMDNHFENSQHGHVIYHVM